MDAQELQNYTTHKVNAGADAPGTSIRCPVPKHSDDDVVSNYMPSATNAVRVDGGPVIQRLYRITQNVVCDNVATAVVTNADVSNAGLWFAQSSRNAIAHSVSSNQLTSELFTMNVASPST